MAAKPTWAIRLQITLWRMAGNNLEAANKVGRPPQVEVKETEIGELSSTLSVPPIRVNIYRCPAVRTAE